MLRPALFREDPLPYTSKATRAPRGGQRQEPNTAEEVAEEAVLLHAHETGCRRSAQGTSVVEREQNTGKMQRASPKSSSESVEGNGCANYGKCNR